MLAEPVRTVASVEPMESIEAFIDRLPKAELHLHLVGSASVPTVLELARRHPDGTVPRSAADLAAFYEFRDFPHFSQVYGAVSSLVREPADVAELVLGAAHDLARQNVRYVELTVTPYTLTSAGMPAAGLTEALDTAARSAGREHGVRMAYIFDIAGEYGGPAAHATLEHALTCPPSALVGFGLAGIEQARPRFAAEFRSVFASAVAAGLHSVPHAGEMSGPATIWEALDGLRAERIGHGISCLDDPALVPAGGLGARAQPFRAGRAGRERGAGLVPRPGRQAGAAGRDRRGRRERRFRRCLMLGGVGRGLKRTFVTPAPPVPSHKAWMPLPCCLSDMAGTSTPYGHATAGGPGGITSHGGVPGSQEYQQGRPGTRPAALYDQLKHGGIGWEQRKRDIHAA